MNTIQHVLSNLVEFIIKFNEAPASAETHLDTAIFLLSEESGDWKPIDDPAILEVIRSSREHMAHYYEAAKKPWPRDELKFEF
jgi:hypothetical protein